MGLLAFAALLQATPTAATETSRHRALAERFVALSYDPGALTDADDARMVDTFAQSLLRFNPGREADARRVATTIAECQRRTMTATLQQAGIEAALTFDEARLERLIAFVEMRDAQQRTPNASNRIPPGWEAEHLDYRRWMYSIGGQRAATVVAQRCAAEAEAAIAAAGLRTRPKHPNFSSNDCQPTGTAISKPENDVLGGVC